MRKLFVSLEFASRPQLKCDAAAISAAGGIINGLLGFVGNERTNALNYQANWETNETNREINESQLAARRKQFEDELAETQRQRAENRAWELEDIANQREYDSALSQKRRFEEAGINPYLAMSNGQLGNIQAGSPDNPSGSVPHGDIPSPIPAVAPHPFSNSLAELGRGIDSAVANYFAAMKTESDVNRQNISNSLDTLRLLKYIENSDVDNEQKRALTNLAINELYENQKTFGDRQKNFSLINDEMQSKINNVNADTFLKNQQSIALEIENKYADVKHKAEVGRIRALTNYLIVQASELIRNGASERELRKQLIHKARTYNFHMVSRYGTTYSAEAEKDRNDALASRAAGYSGKALGELYKEHPEYVTTDKIVGDVVDKAAPFLFFLPK